MILGDICTRTCRFCAVASARKGRPVREEEGEEIALAAEELGLGYVALTSVDRDDLPGRGADHFARCTAALKRKLPGVQVEVLVPDYTEAEMSLLPPVLPDVIAHNVETVRSLQNIRDPRASFDKSLATLKAAKALGVVTKSSLLLGLGEKSGEVLAAMDELRSAAVDILVMGQYLQPAKGQLPVAEYLSPEQFDRYAAEARGRGFSAVIASPLARTSYHAQKGHAEACFGSQNSAACAPEKAAVTAEPNGRAQQKHAEACFGDQDSAACASGKAAVTAEPTGRVLRHVTGMGKPEGCKLIRLTADLEGDCIRNISIRGDFFASPEEGFDRAEERLRGIPRKDLAAAFDRFLAEEGVETLGVGGAAVARVLEEALG
jgi:lipoic acid synthetase